MLLLYFMLMYVTCPYIKHVDVMFNMFNVMFNKPKEHPMGPKESSPDGHREESLHNNLFREIQKTLMTSDDRF